MLLTLRRVLLCLPILVLVGCSSSNPEPPKDVIPSSMSTNAALFDPTTGTVPLPNILVTAAVTTTIVPAVGVPLDPPTSLSWINQNEVGGTHAVAGLSAPIHIRFTYPVDAATVTATNVKIFQLTADTDGYENNPLDFTDLSALFDFEVSADGKQVQATPKVPLFPGYRYLYLVTNRVKDAATGGPVISSVYFEYLKSTTPLSGATAGLEPIRANKMSGTNIQLSGYAKVMDDLIAKTAKTSITKRGDIALMGRFITTGAVASRLVLDNAATQTPIETILWAWANNAPGTPFAAGGPARQWNNGVALTPGYQFSGSAAVSAFWSALPAPLSLAPHTAVGYIALGTFQSGDLNIDPAVVASIVSKPASGDVTGTVGAYNPGPMNSDAATKAGTGILQGVRPDGKTLTGYFHTTRNVPFIFLAPITAAPAGGYPVLIYQHGITSVKEDLLATVNTICGMGYAVIAIDAPLHGGLANGRPASEYGANFMSLPSLLNTRTNFQQGGFNLWRLERMLKQPAADPTSLQAALATAVKPIEAAGASRFLGHSLGTIIGAYFLAGNSSQTGGSNIKAFFSTPGARVAYIGRDNPDSTTATPSFGQLIRAGLAAQGLLPGSVTYNQFFHMVQTVLDTVDPVWSSTPLTGAPVSRLSGRLVVQEAVGDRTILNTYGRYFGNAIGGRGLLGSTAYDFAPNFTHVRATAPAAPYAFMYAPGGVYKTFAVPATSATVGPTEGYFQIGTTAVPASHGMLLDGSTYTGQAQKQLAIWLATGRLADPTDVTHWPIAQPWGEDIGQPMKAFPWAYPN